jgi:quinol monooxygenase YgiN
MEQVAKLVFRVRLSVLPEFRDRVLKSILRLLGPTRAARGCISCNAYVDIENEHTVVYQEEWMTQADLDDRLRGDSLKVLLSAMDLAPTAPAVRFDTISSTRGIEVIQAARIESKSEPEGSGA